MYIGAIRLYTSYCRELITYNVQKHKVHKLNNLKVTTCNQPNCVQIVDHELSFFKHHFKENCRDHATLFKQKVLHFMCSQYLYKKDPLVSFKKSTRHVTVK